MSKNNISYCFDDNVPYEWKLIANQNIEAAKYLLSTKTMAKQLTAKDKADIVYNHRFDSSFINSRGSTPNASKFPTGLFFWLSTVL